MTPEELDISLEELEGRLERLRSLYQQYFLGIEKVEPAVARKDVDRRIWLLRREQIRNTRKRFKLNTLIQRYNTYQQYWMRILREIEAGTYVRHLLRAERSFGAAALGATEKRRLGRRADSDGAAGDAETAASKKDAMVKGLEQELESLMDDASYDPLEAAKRAVDDALGLGRKREAAKPLNAAAPSPERAEPPARAPRAPLDALDLDLDFLGDDEPGPKPVATAPAGSTLGSKPERPPLAKPVARAAAPVTAGTAASPPAPPGAAAKTPARASPAAARPRAAASPAVPTAPTPGRAPGPTAPAPTLGRAPASADRSPATAPARPVPPERATPRRAPRLPAGAQRPAPPAVREPARPEPAARGAASPRVDGMSDDRVREIYNRLVEAKRGLRQSTATVTIDGLAKSLRASLPKLQQKHRGRKVDFDVVVKDGKAVVKPVVK